MINFFIDYIEKRPEKYITYADFIEKALYHPEHGYYMKEKSKIGREGDFITTSNLSDIYGRQIAKWFYKKAKDYGLQHSICEIGAGTGRFAKAFLSEWELLSDNPLQYFILEASPYHRKLQQEMLTFNESVRQIESLTEISAFNGLIFSNELFDAFPVHVIEKRDTQLMEAVITVENEKLAEILVPLSNERVIAFLEENRLEIKAGQRIEIPLHMEGMVFEIASVLDKGLVLTVDYGYTNKEWSEPGRREGSLRGYYKHQQINNILENPGEMDITSHIHVDALINYGDKHGLKFINRWRQDEFLLTAGILEDLQDNYDPNPFSPVSKRNRAIRSLIMPSGISSSFQVILQGKGLLN